jgi:hypothetical protein
MNSLIHCIYSSRATASFSEAELRALLEAARRKNALHGVTGMLLYVERSFFQVLEGDKEAVDTTFRVISSDPRHTRVTQIIREPLARRQFGEWTTGFVTSSLAHLSDLLGENDFFQDAGCLEQLGSGRAKRLLLAFKNGGWRADATGVYQLGGKPSL